jgi:hypothetical protein
MTPRLFDPRAPPRHIPRPTLCQRPRRHSHSAGVRRSYLHHGVSFERCVSLGRPPLPCASNVPRPRSGWGDGRTLAVGHAAHQARTGRFARVPMAHTLLACSRMFSRPFFIITERRRTPGTFQETRVLSGFGAHSLAFGRHRGGPPPGDCLDLPPLDTSHVDGTRLESRLQCLGASTVCGIPSRYPTALFGLPDAPLFVSLFEYSLQVAPL